MNFKVLLDDNSTFIIYTREIIKCNDRTYYMCTKDNIVREIKHRVVNDLNKITNRMFAENCVVVEIGGRFFPEKIWDKIAIYVKPYDKLMDDLDNSVRISIENVVDPHGTADDADNASRDLYYFKQGMKEAFNILLNREFDFEEFKKNHPCEVGMFSSAISCMRGALRVGDTVLKEDLKRMIERL